MKEERVVRNLLADVRAVRTKVVTHNCDSIRCMIENVQAKDNADILIDLLLWVLGEATQEFDLRLEELAKEARI